jgi:hypothetical protein
MTYIIPWLIAIFQGYFLLTTLIPDNARPRMPLFIIWSCLIGMASTALITFTSLCFLDTLIPACAILLNIAVTGGLWFLARRRGIAPPFQKGSWDRLDLIGLHVIILFHIPVILQAIAYPQGGWDAWSCWNLKAKFLFLGGHDWHRMMDPALWRSNIAYPFLLPLINAWYWCFGAEPANAVTVATSCRITFLMSGLLFFGLRELGGRWPSLLAPLWFLSVMFLVTLAGSQYSDLLVGTWLLSALLGFLLFRERKSSAYLALTAISLGCLSFTKSEGMVLSVITLGVMGLAAGLSADARATLRRGWIGPLITLIIAFIPTIIFQLFWAPDSRTFTNAIATAAHPTPLERLQATFVYLGLELISPKWNGSWVIAGGALLLGGRRIFQRGLGIIPAIIFIYMAAITGVYAINSFFPIIWWLSTTLNRILFALIPTVLFWLFASLRKS